MPSLLHDISSLQIEPELLNQRFLLIDVLSVFVLFLYRSEYVAVSLASLARLPAIHFLQSSRRHYVTIKSYSWLRLAKSNKSSPEPLRKERSIFPVSNRSFMMSFFICTCLMSHDRMAQNNGVFPSSVYMFKISKQFSLDSR